MGFVVVLADMVDFIQNSCEDELDNTRITLLVVILRYSISQVTKTSYSNDERKNGKIVVSVELS